MNYDQDNWQDEREVIEREMAERDAKMRREEMLAWAHERKAARDAAPAITRDYLPDRDRAAPPAATLTDDWQRYIKRQISKSAESVIKDMCAAIGQTVIVDLHALEKRCDELEGLRDQVRSLEAQLAELKREAQLHATLESLGERLDRLELRSSAGMKVVNGRAAPAPFESGAGGSLIG